MARQKGPSIRICKVDGCEKPRHGATLCRMHQWRLERHGSLDDRPSLEDRRAARDAVAYEKRLVRGGPDECWGWLGGKSKFGYGQIRIWGKNLVAHRVSWIIHNGPIPDGVCVLHQCDNPPCTNPRHLFLGTKVDNNSDRDAKGRTNKCWVGGVLYRGEQNGRHKLTDVDVLDIVGLHKKGVHYRKISEGYNVTPAMIRHIVTGKNWKHITDGLL